MADTIYHIRRDDMESELQSAHGFTKQEATKIVKYLEKSGTVYFNGPTMQVKDPTTQDAWVIQGLANSILGRTMGSQGTYQLKEYLVFMQRQAALMGVS